MRITLTNAGKRFNREWIFRDFNYDFTAPKKYAITGPNGSGKSTLLQVIAGSLTFNEGSVSVTTDQQMTTKREPGTGNDNFFQHISIAAPYLELIEEMTANELLSFHRSFKPLSLTNERALQIVQLEKAANKQIRYYSSGMKQRLKLAQAFFCKSSVLLLDEPTTNLDAEGIDLYYQLINDYANNKLVIISSNDKQEYEFCEEVISIGDYKAGS
jgi:ABC-2 type transport system ATP-binding protein